MLKRVRRKQRRWEDMGERKGDRRRCGEGKKRREGRGERRWVEIRGEKRGCGKERRYV